MSSTAETKGYNGWANYETWAVALWIDNEEATYLERRGMAEESWEEAEADDHFTRSQRARIDFADDLKEWIAAGQPELEASLWSDLLSAALSEVDWLEIADNWLSEMEGYVPRESQ
jgi:hypothetical protein